MAGRIPQSFIDDLIARVDIVDVIDERVPLKRAGRDYTACCPFHEEKTPSFSVSPAKQFYYCFGCGAHGTAVGFLMDYGHMEFVEAIEELARRTGVEIPREVVEYRANDTTQALYDALEQAQVFYSKQLRDHDVAEKAVTYLKTRGLSGETAAQFSLGFAPPGWDTLAKHFGSAPGSNNTLIQAGLLIEKDQGRGYDRFRDRVMFPIRNRRGQVIGFGARALGDENPKYLNSPETPVFHKGQELYGLYEVKQANRHLDKLFVVEGYMDVVSLFQAGITNAVATLGTAATPDHIQRLFRTTPNVVFCFDGDKAGRRAAWRALENLLPAMKDGWIASFMFLPEGEDPDSIAMAHGKQGFMRLADEATNLSTFLFDTLSSQVDLGSLEGRARLIELARPLLASINADAFKNLALQKLGQISGLNAQELAKLVLDGARVPIERPNGRVRARSNSNPSLVRRAITLLLYRPKMGTLIESTDRLRVLAMPGAELLAEVVELVKTNPTIKTGAIVERFRSHEQGRHLAKLAVEAAPVLDEGLEREFTDAVRKLEQMVDEQRFSQLTAKARAGALSNEEEREFKQLVARSAGMGAS